MVERKLAGFQEKLGQVLTEGGFITSDQLSQARDISKKEGKRIIDVLLEQRYVSRDTLTTALSFQLRIPVVSLKQAKIDPKALELVPERFAREHQVIPHRLRA